MSARSIRFRPPHSINSRQPTAVVRRMHDPPSPRQVMRGGRIEPRIEADDVVRFEVVTDQRHPFGGGLVIPHAATSDTLSPYAIGVGAIDAVPTFAPTPMALGLNVKAQPVIRGGLFWN